MILIYHKVDLEAKTRFWVSKNDFSRQMEEISDKKVVSLYEYNPQDENQVVITFDGVYEDVFKYAFPILKKHGYPFHLFITSNFIAKDNSFDTTEPLAKFATLEQLKEMADNGALLEWHTQSNCSLDNKTPDEDILRELTIPENIKSLQPKGFKWFAYPYGNLTGEKLRYVYERFEGAVSVWQGDNHNKYKLNRLEVHTDTKLDKDSVFFKNPLDRGLISVIVPTYNVEKYLHEFFNCMLTQTYKNLEIIIVLDAPTDNSAVIVKQHAKEDKRIKVIENSENMGVAVTLTRGYAAATGDFCSTISPDDTVDMFFYENLIAKYRETKSDIICGRMLASNNNYMFNDGTDYVLYPFPAKLSALFYFSSCLTRRKLIVEHNIFDEKMVERHWEDIIIKFKCSYYANHVSVCNKAIRYYAMRADSLSHKPNDIQLEYMIKAEKRAADFTKAVGREEVSIQIVNGFKVIGGWDIDSWFRKESNKSNKKKYIKFLGIPLIKIKKDKSYLFGFIPFFTIKNKK